MSKIEVEDRAVAPGSGIGVRVVVDYGTILLLFSIPTNRLVLEPSAAKHLGRLLISGGSAILERKN